MAESGVRRSALLFLVLFILCLTIVPSSWKFFSLRRFLFPSRSYSDCYIWSLNQYNQSSKSHLCPNEDQIRSTVWTHNGSGVLKYLQWLIIRRHASIRLFHLDDRCRILNDTHYHSKYRTHPLILVYILPNRIDQSACSTSIKRIINADFEVNHIYFTRKSIRAMLALEQLDQGTNLTSNLTEYSAHSRFTDHVSSINLMTIYAEDLMEEKLAACEGKLVGFITNLGLNASDENIRHSVKFDSHHFIREAIWWDRSEVIENLLNRSIPTRPTTVNDSNQFYYLHGRRSFADYLLDNRRCFRAGVFVQMPSSNIIPRNSTDPVDRCPSKPFDCAFSDLYSFEDREDMYHSSSFRTTPIKCAFAVPSVFDLVRERYARNETCETIVLTVITGCYDPLPEVQGTIDPSFCFIALVDNRTMNAFVKRNATGGWDLINFGNQATPFSVEPKTTETIKLIGLRMFPLAKWILWLDGKARITNLNILLTRLSVPFTGAHHPEWERNMENEVPATIGHMHHRAGGWTLRFNNTLRDILLQEAQYHREGTYNRSRILGLRLYDIAVLMYRNQQPCIQRYMCSWHNEINFYSFRGQLSVYYPAIRLNLADYTDFLEHSYFATMNHRPIC